MWDGGEHARRGTSWTAGTECTPRDVQDGGCGEHAHWKTSGRRGEHTHRSTQADVQDGEICLEEQVVDRVSDEQDTTDSGHHCAYSERDMDTQRDVLEGELPLSMTK